MVIPIQVSACSVGELHRRFGVGGAPCPDSILRQMKSDSRRGVQRLFRRLQGREQRTKAEEERLDGMLVFEQQLWSSGVIHLAGIDEAGVGPLAGPVVAAAVVCSPGIRIYGVNDSKRLLSSQRVELARAIRQQAVSVGIGVSEVEEIDRLNVYQAALLAMQRAVAGLSVEPQHVLVDGRFVPGLKMPQQWLVRGDQRSFSIAAASIIAKTYRDELMEKLDEEYPGYGFARHKGYGTAEHCQALRRLGPAAPHRHSFSPVRRLVGR